MRGPVNDFNRGDTIVLGITIKDKLGARTNPTNGVKCRVINAADGTTAGDTESTWKALTQGRYNEEDTSTAGQYFYNLESSDTWTTGYRRTDFLIDDSGTFEGRKVFNPVFRIVNED